MKTSTTRHYLASLLGLGAAGVLLAATPVTAPASPADQTDKRVEVIFDHPEKFTDIKGDSMDSPKGRDVMLDQIRDILETAGAGVIPAGQKLTITFTDIDLAGEYEPWRGGQWSDVRIIKDIYPPHFVFSYKLTDAAGAVLKEDKVDLRDLTFMMRVTISRDEPLRFEKDILNDWIRSVVPRKK
jgi:Protein of unknown function (DUF3016)